jgi:protein TonB
MPRVIAGQISNADYPPSALRNGQQGRTDARLAIDANGRVTRCLIAHSSGHSILDRRTCDLWLTRVRFSPALDAAGQAIAIIAIVGVVWAIDEPAPPAPKR